MLSLSEILNEAIGNGFTKFKKFGSKPSGGTSDGPGGRLQLSRCRLEKKTSQVTGQEKEYIAVYLSHIYKGGAQEVADAINSSVPKQVMHAVANEAGREKVIIRVNIDLKSEIDNSVNKMRDALESLGKYNKKSVETLCDDLSAAIDKVVTSADYEAENKNAVSNWQSMLKNLNDPEVKKRLLRYSLIDNYASAYGHVLRERNVNRVLNQFPDATFVAERLTWKKKFNRTVAPGAQHIIVKKPVYGATPSIDELDAAAKQCGFKDGYKSAMQITKNSTQVHNRIRIIACGNAPAKYFEDVVMYDVSQTIPPSDPSKDKWTLEFGLSDNINGVMNPITREYDEKEHEDRYKDIRERNRQASEEADKRKLPNMRASIDRLCNRAKVDMSRYATLNDTMFIVQGAYEYAKQVAPSYGIIKIGDVNRIASMCAAAVCISCNIDSYPPDLPMKFKYGEVTEADAMTVVGIMNDIIPSLRLGGTARGIQPINLAQNESRIRRGLRILRENGDADRPITFAEFVAICKRYIPSVDMEANESIGRVKKMVSEEVLNVFKNRKKGRI